MVEITSRTKRPVTVRTLEWTGTNREQMYQFTGIGPFMIREDGGAQVYDRLHDSWVNVYPGQHVVQGVAGEFYPIAPDVLARTYQDPSEPDVMAELAQLRQDSAKLSALESAGVDNWSGYSYAMEILHGQH